MELFPSSRVAGPLKLRRTSLGGNPPFRLYPTKIAALAFLNSHIPPRFTVTSSAPLSYSAPGLRLSSRPLSRSRFTTAQLLSFSVLFLVLVVQFFRPLPQTLYQNIWEPKHDKISEAVCRNPHILTEPPPISRPHRMSLLEEVRRVATQFDYSAEEVNKGVKEFIRQMGWCQLL